MTRTVAALLAPVRPALMLTLVGIATLLSASLLAPTMSAQSVLVLAALATATAAMLGARRVLVQPGPGTLRLPARRADEVLPHLAGRSTDVVHHPQRPRAPGPV